MNQDFRDLFAAFNAHHVEYPIVGAHAPVSVISRDHLIRNKRASGRTQDLADLESLGA